MSINSERSKAIKAELKKLGYNSRQISVRSSDCGYSDRSEITIKDLSVDMDAVKKACLKFEKIRYDERAGEILAGCNTFIRVNYSYGVLKEATEAQLQYATDLVKKIEAGGNNRVYELKDGTEYFICKVESWVLKCNGTDEREKVIQFELVENKNGYGRVISDYPKSLTYMAYELAEKIALWKAQNL